MKVPYPTGFYAKGLDGRIDDPNALERPPPMDVKRRPRTVAKGMTPMAVQFQMRPDPLAD